MTGMHTAQLVYPVASRPGLFQPAGNQNGRSEPAPKAAPSAATSCSATLAPGRPASAKGSPNWRTLASASDQQRRDAIMALPEAVGVEAAADAIWRQGGTVEQARAMLPALQTDFARGAAIAQRIAGSGARLDGATPTQRADFERGAAIARRFGSAEPSSALPRPAAGPASQLADAMTDRERGAAIARKYSR